MCLIYNQLLTDTYSNKLYTKEGFYQLVLNGHSLFHLKDGELLDTKKQIVKISWQEATNPYSR